MGSLIAIPCQAFQKYEQLKSLKRFEDSNDQKYMFHKTNEKRCDPDLDGITSTVSDPVWNWSILLLLLGQNELLTEFFVSRHFSELSKIMN